jgi:hypothetical protein
VETGLNTTRIGKLLMSATFITDLATVAALSLLFLHPTRWLVPFVSVSVALIVAMPGLDSWFLTRYGDRVTEPELRGAFAALLILMWLGSKASRPAHVHPRPDLAPSRRTRRCNVVSASSPFAVLTPVLLPLLGDERLPRARLGQPRPTLLLRRLVADRSRDEHRVNWGPGSSCCAIGFHSMCSPARARRGVSSSAAWAPPGRHVDAGQAGEDRDHWQCHRRRHQHDWATDHPRNLAKSVTVE